MAWGYYDKEAKRYIPTIEEAVWRRDLDHVQAELTAFFKTPVPGTMAMQKEYDRFKKAWEAFEVAWYG